MEKEQTESQELEESRKAALLEKIRSGPLILPLIRGRLDWEEAMVKQKELFKLQGTPPPKTKPELADSPDEKTSQRMTLFKAQCQHIMT